jgi:hypothetical protein
LIDDDCERHFEELTIYRIQFRFISVLQSSLTRTPRDLETVPCPQVEDL